MARFTYFYIEPKAEPPFKKKVRFTRGDYVKTTEPMGPFSFRYAVFRNRRSELLVPSHDLTSETKLAIKRLEEEAAKPPH